jgi:hypothetical protein
MRRSRVVGGGHGRPDASPRHDESVAAGSDGGSYVALGVSFFLRRSLTFGARRRRLHRPVIGTEIAAAHGTWQALFLAFGAAGLLALLEAGRGRRTGAACRSGSVSGVVSR